MSSRRNSGSKKTASNGCEKLRNNSTPKEQRLRDEQAEKIREREQKEAEMGHKIRGQKPTLRRRWSFRRIRRRILLIRRVKR